MSPQNKSERATPLLTTKFYIPRFRTSPIARSRLENKLTTGLNRNLTLVSAAAGFGKSTLVSEWLRRQEMAPGTSAWLSLDEDDNDPVRFLAYLTAALPESESNLSGTDVPADAADATGSIKPSLTAVINTIASQASEFVLVLDDYHIIQSAAVHDAVAFLLDHAPRQMHLILIGRSDPPLLLSRLRARGELLEIRDRDLAFTESETAVFLNDVMGLDLAPEQITVLHSRTEGWVAGLQLAALAIQELKGDERRRFIDMFNGSHHYIIDYVVEEILNQQPPQVKSFLLDTAVLDRFCASLCDAIMADQQSGHSQPILARLEAANLFLIPLDNERHWFRYHHLFADFLRHRLQRQQPERLPTLHRRASSWYERQGLVEEALRHALRASDFERAATLLLDYNIPDTLFKRGEITTLYKWLHTLPDELIRNYPLLCLAYAWTLTLTDRLDSVEAYLDAAESPQQDQKQTGMQSQYRQRAQSNISIIRSEVALRRGQIDLAAKHAQAALDTLPDGAPGLQSIAALNLGIAYLLQGEIERAEQVLADARQASVAASHLYLNVSTLCTEARLREQQGQLHQAAHLYRYAVRVADRDAEGNSASLATIAYVGLADLHREWNQFDAALAYLDRHTIGKELQGSSYDLRRFITLARIKQAQGSSKEAFQLLHEAERIAQRNRSALDSALIKAWQARLYLAQDNVSAAQQSLQSVTAALLPFDPANDPLLSQWETVYAAQARIYIAQGSVEMVLPHLEKMLDAATNAGRTASAVELLVLKARAHQAQGDLLEALTAVQRALALAEPGGYIRLFIDEGAPLATLLQGAVAQGGNGRYALQVLTAFSHLEDAATASDSPAENLSWALVEPLSQREREVLQLLATGLSNREIAQQLVIAEETVRWHTKNIYRKLAVHNRTQAAARAQNLGLLSSIP